MVYLTSRIKILLETISLKAARRLALARAGLLKPEWTDMPSRASGRGKRARDAAHKIINRFGYLQLDTVSIAGARSHAIVLLSRLDRFDPAFAEELLQPGSGLFEYWGHEASWMPLELYPAFEFRRKGFLSSAWYKRIMKGNLVLARRLLQRIRDEGPLRSLDMEGRGSRGWWNLKVARKVAQALWSTGELSIRARKNFQRSFDLTERVIEETWRSRSLSRTEAFESLLLKALDGHGWASTGTLAQTWRLTNKRAELVSILRRLGEQGRVVSCALERSGQRPTPGWIRPVDLELAERLRSVRPRNDCGVLLSPFDPLLWDRLRVARLFNFDCVLEIFKPAPQRRYGYYCLPVLAGEHLVARFDLKADGKAKKVHVLAAHYEDRSNGPRIAATSRKAARYALQRYAEALQLKVVGPK